MEDLECAHYGLYYFKSPCIAGTEECPLEWHEFEDKCYYISTISLKWEQAQEDCQNRDSELVVINNEMEQVSLC